MMRQSVLILALLGVCISTGLPASALQNEDEVMRQEVRSLDPVLATQSYLDRLTPEQRARSESYWNGGYWVSLLDFLLGLVIGWLLLWTRISLRMRKWAQRYFSRKYLVTAVYAIQYIILTTLLFFPFTVYAGWWREHQYGLSNQAFLSWCGERAIGLGLSLLFLTVLLAVIYGVISRFPQSWWLWSTAVMVGALVFLLIISPVFVAPLFNTYTPMEKGPLKERILQLARASGVPAEDVNQFDASRQSKRISANVSGFLGTMRISLNDNLLKRCTAEEVAAVMAHEIGHYVLNHMYEMLVYFSILILVGFLFIRWGFGMALRCWGQRWGVQGLGDVAGLPLLVVLFSTYLFLITPIVNNIIRSDEVEADHFGLAAAREPDGFAEAAFKLAEYRKLDPSRLEEWLFYDHPSGKSRILMAMRFRAAYVEAEPQDIGLIHLHQLRPADPRLQAERFKDWKSTAEQDRFALLLLDVLLDRDPARAHRQIPSSPDIPTPEPLAQIGELLQQHPRVDPFEPLSHLTNLLRGSIPDKQVDMKVWIGKVLTAIGQRSKHIPPAS